MKITTTKYSIFSALYLIGGEDLMTRIKNSRSLAVIMPVVLFAVAVLTASSANAQNTWYSAGNNIDLVHASSWNSAMDGSGIRPAQSPAVASDDTWVIIDGDRLYAPSTLYAFRSQTLRIDDGEMLLWNLTSSVRDVILNGPDAAINIGEDDGDILWGQTLTLNDGVIGTEAKWGHYTVKYRFLNYTGNGDIVLQTRRNNKPISGKAGSIEFVGDGDFSTFTGNFIIQEGITVGFDFHIPDGTFGLTVEDSGGQYHERYNLMHNVTVTSLTLGAEPIGPGTYTYNDFTSEQQKFFKNSGGRITVTPVPEPSACSLCLISLAGLAFARIRSRQGDRLIL